MRSSRFARLFLLALGLAGCRTAPPPTATSAILRVDLKPSPVTAIRTPSTGWWVAPYQVVVRDIAGVGGLLRAVESEVRTPDGRLVARTTATAERPFTGYGSASVDLLIQPLDGAPTELPGQLTVTVSALDDRGNPLVIQVEATVQ